MYSAMRAIADDKHGIIGNHRNAKAPNDDNILYLGLAASREKGRRMHRRCSQNLAAKPRLLFDRHTEAFPKYKVEPAQSA